MFLDSNLAGVSFLDISTGEFLTAEGNYEYPVLKDIQPSKLVSSWGEFKDDTISINTLGENNKAAVKIFDKAGWK